MKKKLIIVLFSAVLLGTLTSVFILIRSGTAPSKVSSEGGANAVPAQAPEVAQGRAESQEPTEPYDEKASIKILASAFAEGYGSYSNQQEGPHFAALHPFMTEKMKKWTLEHEGNFKKSLGDPKVYHGYTTKVVSDSGLTLNSASSAEIRFKTLRSESLATRMNVKNFYQDITIKLEKVDGVWKVDGAFFGPQE